MTVVQTASGRPVVSEKLKRKDYEIAALKRQLSEQRRELDDARRQLRRIGKDDEPSTVMYHCIMTITVLTTTTDAGVRRSSAFVCVCVSITRQSQNGCNYSHQTYHRDCPS